jgi:DNA end-binding protein Ku
LEFVMAARAYWKGYLKLSLVSCSISVNPATSSSERVSFRQINKQTGNRLRQQLVDDVTREPVEAEDKGRGYEVDKGVFIQVEDDEIEALQVESTHTVEIDNFVPAAQIDKRFYDSPYYVFPNDNVGQEAFAVIRDAMKGKGAVALGRIVLNKRERVMALEPFGKGLLGTTLHYAYEVRDAADYFDDISDVKISGEMLKLAQHIMEGKSGEFDPSAFNDHYETALVEMLKQKQAGFKPPKGKEKPAAPNVVNLMDALRQSIAAGRRTPAAEKASSKAEKAAPKKGKKQVAGQREMLLPIEGKKTKEVKKPAAKPAGKQRKAG